jgi:hypothetical protein
MPGRGRPEDDQICEPASARSSPQNRASLDGAQCISGELDLVLIHIEGFVRSGCRQIDRRRDDNGPPQKPMQPLDLRRLGLSR